VSTHTFIAGDWGTTQLRLYLCNDEQVIATKSGRGIGALQRTPAEEFASVAGEWLSAQGIDRIVLAGMVGSRNGWHETAYVPCPASLVEVRAAFAHVSHEAHDIAIVPGLSCTSPLNSPDVMRGEETQLLGALEVRESLRTGRHVIALPGTHSKWAVLEDATIVRFQTAITGELFALLRQHSTLLKAGVATTNAIDEDAFDAGARSASSAALIQQLFQVRSRQLVEGWSADHAASFLSGLLIGADVDSAHRLFAPTHVTLICEPTLATLYSRALAPRGVTVERLDGADCVLAGLRALAA